MKFWMGGGLSCWMEGGGGGRIKIGGGLSGLKGGIGYWGY